MLEILKLKLKIMEELANDPKTSIKSFPAPSTQEVAGCETGRISSKVPHTNCFHYSS